MVSSKVITILSIATCLLTLTSVGLTAYHSVVHMSVESNGVVTKTTSSDTTNCPPAVKIKYEIGDTEITGSCPFKPATKAIAFISLILCQFLLILLCCKLKNKVSSMVIVIFAIIDFPLLLVGGILMIVDMINGKKELGDTTGISYQPIEFIIDILFVFFGLICGGAATFFAYTNKPPSYPSQPTQHGNASMSVTKPHWTEGESQSQSTDYIKPYPQANISTYQAYQGGSASTSHNTSTAYLNSNNANPNGRGSQVYQAQNEQYLESSQNYDNTGGYGNRRNVSYKDNPQTRQRQQSNANNFNYGGNQQGNNSYDNTGSSYGNTPQRNVNRNLNNNNSMTYETNANNQNNYNNNNGSQNNYNGNQSNNNPMAGPQNRGNRNNYPGSNRSQMYTNNNNNNDTTAYERSPERSTENRSYANGGNGGNGRPNKFNSAVNRIGAMRGGANAFENGSNNRGYLNYGNENNNQGNMNNFDENPLDYYTSSPNNRGRARSNNQSNYEEQQYQEEGNYQRANNQRNTHVSQINGNNIPYNNNGMGRPAANSIENSRPSQNYGGY